MSLRDAAEHVRDGRARNTCRVAMLKKALSPANLAELVEMMADEDELSTVISEAVREEWGHTIGAHSIARHRRKDCRCGSI